MALVMGFLGEFECKVDAKGRLMVPSALRKQLDPDAGESFVMNRGFEKCLVLYPKNKWKEISDQVNRLNKYVKKNRDFVRFFYRGATELSLDSSARILLPKQMMGYAGLEKKVILFAYADRIEVWDEKAYNEVMDMGSDDFADLAEDVMGGLKSEEGGGDVS